MSHNDVEPDSAFRQKKSSSRRGLTHVVATLAGLVAAGVLAIAGTLYFEETTHHAQDEQRRYALRTLSVIRSQFESYLNDDLYRAKGLALLPVLNHRVDRDIFKRAAVELAGNDKRILSLQLAQDGIVSHVWPYQRNRSALGHDLLADPGRRVAAQWAIDSHKLWVAGPVKLKQGGVALIGRYPIFLKGGNASKGEETFWGFASILINWPALMQEAFASIATSSDYDIGLRGKDGLGEAGAQIYGQPGIFDLNPVTLAVTLPGGTWDIAAVPRDGWIITENYLFLQKAFYAGLTMILGVAVFFWLRAYLRVRSELRLKNNELQHERDRLTEIIDAIPAGFAIFDKNERLAIYNQVYAKHHFKSDAWPAHGRKAIDCFKHHIEGNYLAREGELPESHKIVASLSERYAKFKQVAPFFDELTSEGQVIRTVQRRTRLGSIALIRVDVTDLHNNIG